MYVPFLPIILPLIMILLVAIGEAKTICIGDQEDDSANEVQKLCFGLFIVKL